MSEFLLPKNYHHNLEKTLLQNTNVGYIHLQNNRSLNESSWVPLLPGYTVYTSLVRSFFKLSIKREENSLLFFWQNFGKDFTFTNCITQGQEKLGFYLMMKQYNVKNLSLTSVLGLNEPNIIEILQKNSLQGFFPSFFLSNKKRKDFDQWS